MKNTYSTGQAGFTLIETLMAMAIFTIGILGLFGMQHAVITKNLTANSITTGSTWATDKIEQLLARRYIDLQDTDTDGCNGLNDWPAGADGSFSSNSLKYSPPEYKIYWNVAKNCLLTSIPTPIDEREEQKPKYIRVIVTVNYGGVEKQRAVFNYIKQNAKNSNSN